MKIQVKVKPNAHKSYLYQLADGTWLAQIKAPPVNGKANEELCALIARQFNVSKTRIMIKSGGGGRIKLIEIASF
jgi:uncharacterized protein